MAQDKQFSGKTPLVGIAEGVKVPQIGFGTFCIPPKQTQQAVEEALQIGYEHIDTAAAYMNEKGVGAALAATGAAGRTFVTTKLRNCDQGYDETLHAAEVSLSNLGLDAIDLYLIHWPYPKADKYVDSWRALIRLRREGVVRAIGVSNFLSEHLNRLVSETGVAPSVDQVESHPRFWRPGLDRYCAEQGVAVEAYSPLGHGKDIQSDPVNAAAARLGVTPAQVVLRWHVQKGHIVIPKSQHPERMRQNLDVTGFMLKGSEVAAIDALDCPEGRVSGDPREFAYDQSVDDMVARGNFKREDLLEA